MKIVFWKCIWRRASAPQTMKTWRGDFKHVFNGELREIHLRRLAAGIEITDSDGIDDTWLSHNLTGLALSGGGVRSATFCLGVVQAFIKAGIYRQFDYLSTVSGGGYIGSTLSSSLMGRDESLPTYSDPPLLRASSPNFEDESEIVQHLRDHSKYLAPGRSSFLVFPALIFLGFTINMLMSLPVLIWLSFLVMATMFIGRIPHATVLIFCVLSAWAALYALAVSRGPLNVWWSSRRGWLNLTVLLILALAAFVFLRIQTDAIDFVKDIFSTSILDAISRVLASLSALGIFFGVIGYAMSRFGRLATRIWRIILGLAAPLLFWLVVLAIVSTLVNPCTWYSFEQYAGIPIVEKLRAFSNSHRYFDLAYSMDCLASEDGPNLNQIILVYAEDLYTVFVLYVVVSIILLILVLSVNVNATSLHAFYRDRLRAAYIWRADPAQRSKLSELPAAAPYHLLNAAINVQYSEQNLRGRDAQTFFFSKLFCGSAITGWCPTPDIERADGQLDLAAAMAISGAAVAPNQGLATNRPLRFLMAIANARLGYWLVNPARLLKASRPDQTVRPYFFLLELLGRLDETKSRIYVSDGGHIENLGAYELLRRRCKFIVIVDAEQDASHTFHGLAHLVRIAKIDFDYDIELSMQDMQTNEFGYSRAHCALGYVQYGPSEFGSILYIKASLTGDENEYIKEYKSRLKEFPHESTTEQFFSEEQFEAYRALGFHIGNGLVATYSGKRIDSFFDHLRDILVIDVVDKDSYLKVQDRIMKIRVAEGRATSQSSKTRIMEEKLHLMEFSVLKLNLNQAYVASGPCRNIVQVFSGWLRDEDFCALWQQEIWRYGDDLRRFAQNHSGYVS